MQLSELERVDRVLIVGFGLLVVGALSPWVIQKTATLGLYSRVSTFRPLPSRFIVVGDRAHGGRLAPPRSGPACRDGVTDRDSRLRRRSPGTSSRRREREHRRAGRRVLQIARRKPTSFVVG
jgi:hypothetical protein